MLIYGNLGFPAYGVAGAAMATSLSMGLQTIWFWEMWRRGRLILEPGAAPWRPDRAILRSLVVIGYPSSIEQALFQAGLLGFQRIMSLYGTAAVAAYNVGAQILSFSFIPGVGFATAAATLMGQHLGAGDPDEAERSSWRSNFLAMGSMTVVGGLVAWFAEPLAGVFTDDAEVVSLTVDFIYVLALVQPVMAVEFAVGGALRGAGDTFFPMICVFIGLFLVRLIPATLLVWLGDVSIQLVWCMLIADYLIKAILLAARLKKGRWRDLEI